MKIRPNNLFLYIFINLIQVILTSASAQSDTLSGISDDVIVTATRTERKFSNVTVPASIISQQELKNTQLRRLNEILQEQTGIFITSGSGSGSFGGGIFGNGAQLQGMSPEYTLILVNGEPIIGRQGGVVNLSRLTLNGIKKIEVIKGPVSSLYGSEAMGGVINIITEMPNASQAGVSIKAGGYGLLDAQADGNFSGSRTKANLSYNHFRQGAIDFDKNSFGNQQDPFQNHTFQANLSHQFSNRTRLLVYGRFFAEENDNVYEVADENLQSQQIAGFTRIYDGNLNTSLQHRFSQNVSSTFRVYGTGYHSRQELNTVKDNIPFYTDDFRQQFVRIENQTDVELANGHRLTAGAGWVGEYLQTTRYEGNRSNQIAYGFVQDEWNPTARFTLIGGLRYDHNQAYASRLSPKLSLRYAPSEKLKFTASYGAGFKAPDFRQLYLSFINNASGGYALFGANEISTEKLQAYQQQGFIETILPRANDLQELRPETSHGLNAGIKYEVNRLFDVDINFFHNDLSNQILFDVIALRPNGSQVFSYFNVARSFTQGIEINMRYRLHTRWVLSGGYQFVKTGDKDVKDAIKNGEIFGRKEESGQVYQLQPADYMGLPGRSNHMANLKLLYESIKKGWTASLRAVYRSRWGTFDQDGNGIINRKDETAEGFLMLNASVQKEINGKWKAGAGIENILNHRDAVNLPNMTGINAFVSLSWKWHAPSKK
ncbi:MAG: TonB-dependent receptor [Chitinophagaceae bacterium]|nr:TonB-dependent receptor [Chitinophagaceae bacterium]